MYATLRQDPLVNGAALLREAVLPTFPQTAEDPDKFMAEQQAPAGPAQMATETEAVVEETPGGTSEEVATEQLTM